ncbi:MAG: hypothetical protein ACTSQY_11400 [Candidatus Odinarchaeia archaeon]
MNDKIKKDLEDYITKVQQLTKLNDEDFRMYDDDIYYAWNEDMLPEDAANMIVSDYMIYSGEL